MENQANHNNHFNHSYLLDPGMLQRVLGEIPGCCFFKDTEFRYRALSHFEVLFGGVKEEEILGKTDLELIGDTEIARIIHDDDQKVISLQKESQTVQELVLDGVKRFYHISKRAVRDDSGNLLGIIGLVNDITRIREEETWKQNQLDMMIQMNEIDKILLKFHKDKEYINKLLKIIAAYEEADRAYIFEFTSGTFADNTYEYCTDHVKSQIRFLQNIDFSEYPYWMDKMKQHEMVIIDDLDLIRESRPTEYEILHMQDIHNLYAVPIYSSYDAEDKLVAFLGVDNPTKSMKNTYFLERLAFGLSIAFDNYKEYCEIQRINTYDLATGVLNRNWYVKYVQSFKKRKVKSLGCIYLDVNGLHAYNNQFGHIAGDLLLRNVGSTLNEIFPECSVFRQGGDEFIVISDTLSEKELDDRITLVCKTLDQQGISISAGLEYRTENLDPEDMLKKADSKMYTQKDLFYKEKRKNQNEKKETELLIRK